MTDPPSLSFTDHLPTKVDVITKGSQAPNIDRDIRVAHANKYPLQVWYFLASLIFLITLLNIAGLGLGYYHDKRNRRRLSRASRGPEAQNQPNLMRGSISILRLPHALADTFRAISFRWTISIGRSYTLNLAEVVFTAIYISICFAWALINTTSTVGLKFDPTYYANIAGNIASIQLPLIAALGMKNNIISYLTGVGFDKLLYLHSMVSRVVVVLIWLHAGGRIHIGLAGAVNIHVPAIQAGILAGVALTILSVVSIRPIRDKSYEFFLIVHLVLAVICVLSAYFHAASLKFGRFVWPAILLWGLDRVLRILRVVLSLFTKTTASTSAELKEHGFQATKPRLELLSNDVVVLTAPTPRFFHWRPGQSVYLSFPGISLSPFEAHPFTIATIPDCTDNYAPGDDRQSAQGELKFFIRVRTGTTRRLRSFVETGKEFKVLFDGPYSSPPVLMGYDSVVLVAGGSGISFTFPLFLHMIQRTKKNGPACRRLTFVWMIRHVEYISWIQSSLTSALDTIPEDITLNIHLFITGSSRGRDRSLSSSEEGGNPEALKEDTHSEFDEKFADNLKGSGNVEGGDSGTDSRGDGSASPTTQNIFKSPVVQIHRERADLEKLLTEEVAVARDSMSVNVCGTRGLEKAVRKAIRKPRIGDILRGGPTVSLHIEGFGSGVGIYEEFLCNNFGLIFMLYSEFPIENEDRKKTLGICVYSVSYDTDDDDDDER